MAPSGDRFWHRKDFVLDGREGRRRQASTSSASGRFPSLGAVGLVAAQVSTAVTAMVIDGCPAASRERVVTETIYCEEPISPTDKPEYWVLRATHRGGFAYRVNVGWCYVAAALERGAEVVNTRPPVEDRRV